MGIRTLISDKYVGRRREGFDGRGTISGPVIQFPPKAWKLFVTAPVLTSWVDSGTPVETLNVGDHLGGTAAVTTQDDDVTAIESHSHTDGVLSIGTQYRIITYVKKDAVTSRFPEFQNVAGAQFAHWQMNTSTGAGVIRSQGGWTDVSLHISTAPENSGWWKCILNFTSQSVNTLTLRVAPAMGTTLGGASAASTVGSITWYPLIRAEKFE